MTRVLVCSFLAVGLAATSILGQQSPLFRTSGETVPVFVTVTDKDNRLVTTLGRDDFEVRDNGRVQPLTVFDSSPQPIRIVVLLDVSGSMVGNLALLRRAADELFTRLEPNDLAKVGTFGETITISPTFTRDLSDLRAALPEDISPRAPTPLWRAVDEALDAVADTDGRPVVLVLSDGKDSMFARIGQRYVGQLEVVERAQRDEVMIYAVGLHSRGPRPSVGFGRAGADLGAMMAADFPDPGLGTAAIETGGGYFEIRPRDDLGAAFARVADELHSQYLLGFAPAALDGKRHKIEVRVKVKDLKPRARRNYEAPGN